VHDVQVRAGGIDLGQLLKFAGLVDTGGDAKALLAEGVVTVNGEVDTRRGRTLRDGDVVTIPDAEPVRVVEA
jgi:ribosome-associated protein YbcJ (S4-like RNA binding protein)